VFRKYFRKYIEVLLNKMFCQVLGPEASYSKSTNTTKKYFVSVKVLIPQRNKYFVIVKVLTPQRKKYYLTVKVLIPQRTKYYLTVKVLIPQRRNTI